MLYQELSETMTIPLKIKYNNLHFAFKSEKSETEKQFKQHTKSVLIRVYVNFIRMLSENSFQLILDVS